ncbi:MAG: hypothetical protein IKQ39_06600 [Oscillospiraceae bacterium]|nr:hypothetical protein [Oscillospiraceae bacterium]
MDSKHDANELNLDEAVDAARDAAEGVRPVRRKKRRPRNPDGTPVRRPRPAAAAEDAAEEVSEVAAEAERLFAANSPAAEQGERPRRRRRPRNPDGTPVRRPRPLADAAEDEGFEVQADRERDPDAALRPRRKRRPRPEEEAVSETERLLNDEPERDFEEVQRRRRKRRMRSEGALSAAAALAAAADETEAAEAAEAEAEEAAEEIAEELPDAAEALTDEAEDEFPELDLDWRNDPEFAGEDDDDFASKPKKKKGFFARLFGSKDDDEDEEDEDEASAFDDYTEDDYYDPDSEDAEADSEAGEDAEEAEAEEAEALTGFDRMAEEDGADTEASEDIAAEETPDIFAEEAESDADDADIFDADDDVEYDDEDDGGEDDEDYDDDDEDEDEDDDDYDYYDEEEPGKKSRGLIIGIVAVCAAAVCITAGCLVYVKSQPSKMLDLLRVGDYNGAASYYQNHSYAESGEIDEVITAQADIVRQKYLNEEISYDQALTDSKQLETIQSMRSRTDFSCADAIELIHDSRVHYDAGMTALEARDYNVAIEEFGKTCEADTKYYEDAQKRIKEAEDGREKVKNDEIQQIISEANSLAKADSPDYLAAYKKLSEAAPLYENDERLTSVANMMRTSYINEKITSANGLAAEHLYDDALGLLEIANTEMPDTLEIPAKIDEIKSQSKEYAYNEHKQQVLAEAAEAFDLYGAENAIVVLQSAADLANDEDIKLKIAEYEAQKVVAKELTITDQHGAIKKVPTAKTSKGTELTDVYQYQVITTYNPIGITYSAGENGGYTRVSLTAAPDELFTAGAQNTVVVRVYADGKVVFTSDAITSETEPLKLNAVFPKETKVIRITVEDTSKPEAGAAPVKLFTDIYGIEFA